jgi:hypothetical protein
VKTLKRVIKTLSKLAIVLLLATAAATVLAETTEAPTEPEPIAAAKPTDVEGLIRYHAAIHGANADDMVAVARCESGLVTDIQSKHTYREGNRWGFPAGTREKSFGLAQIHLPDNPTVTYAQAIDPDFAAEFMARKFAAGRQSMWTCAKKLGIV